VARLVGGSREEKQKQDVGEERIAGGKDS